MNAFVANMIALKRVVVRWNTGKISGEFLNASDESKVMPNNCLRN